jgi:hypothetical protein
MNWISSNNSSLTIEKKINKSIKLVYADIPIPLDYKHQLIKIRITNAPSGILLNGIPTTATFIVPVMSAVGYRTIYIPKEDTTVFIKKGNVVSLDISFFDMNNNPVVFTDNYTLQLMIS